MRTPTPDVLRMLGRSHGIAFRLDGGRLLAVKTVHGQRVPIPAAVRVVIANRRAAIIAHLEAERQLAETVAAIRAFPGRPCRLPA